MDYITTNSNKWNTRPPLRTTGRFPVGKTTAQRTGPKIKLKKILTVIFHDLGGHYVLDFSQGQKAPSKLNTSKLY